MPTLSVITPWFGRGDLLPAYTHAVSLADEVVIIDNGSDAQTAQALRAYSRRAARVVLLRNEANLGFAHANNQGLAVATSEIVVFLNSDIQGNPAWVSQARSEVQAGSLIGPSLQRQLVYGMAIAYLEGWCLAGMRQDFETLGGWDEAYPLYWEDNDLCWRAWRAGLGLRHRAWEVQHLGGQSSVGGIIAVGAQFEQSRARFAELVRPYWEAEDARRRAALAAEAAEVAA